MKMDGIAGQHVVVTGAAGYLCRDVCRALAKNGARLTLVDTNEESLSALTEDLRRAFPRIELNGVHRFDALDTEALDAAFTDWERCSGAVTSVVQAAYPRTADWHLEFERIPFESWRQNVDAHLNGYIHVAQRAARLMAPRAVGNLIFFGSIYGLVGPDFNVYRGVPGMTMPAAYAAIKGAIANMVRYLAAYLGPQGIRVNSICPGGVRDRQPAEFIAAYEQRVPLRRMATVDDIVGPLLFLVSDLSRYVTGQNLPVDGGWTAI